ncbi:hypothetical protein [Streptococcus sp. zg-JUN1979]|uniref:DUF7204 family protein n=1 Tax=Streptococcus sp. zg-JUN1979 TaxID=3391450 RepID=UPI0039A71A69
MSKTCYRVTVLFDYMDVVEDHFFDNKEEALKAKERLEDELRSSLYSVKIEEVGDETTV